MRRLILVLLIFYLALASFEPTPLYASNAFRGHLVWGHEVRSFRPCGMEVEYWVVDRTGGELWDVYRALTHEPYQPLYAELRGDLGPSPSIGFGVKYEKQLTVLELRRAARETRGCEENLGGIEFRASGNEPFWNVTVSKNEIIFSELGMPKIIFPHVPPKLSRNHFVYSSRALEPAPYGIEITMDEKRCIDSMSGEHFSFAAQVSLDGRKYTGCARQGWSGLLTIEGLKNAEYQSEFSVDGRVRLSNGTYRGKMLPDSATELIVILSDQVALGDLNGDGADDAAVVLITDPGGSGTFHHLSVLINEDGSPKHVASQLLGDRIKVKSLFIRSEEIAVEMIKQGPNDPMCCPTLQVAQHYVLQGSKLVIAGVRELMNKRWALRSFGTEDSEDPLLPRTSISLEFAADGKLHGSGGCNRYFAAYEIGPGDSLKIKSIGSTRMACPQEFMDQELRYFEALQSVSVFKVENELLQLFCGTGRQVLNFIPVPLQ